MPDILSFPPELPAPSLPETRPFAERLAAEQAHAKQLAQWLAANGWSGSRTGQTIRFPVKDGYAIYMLADGDIPALIHLAYGESYAYPEAQFLSIDAIEKRIDEQQREDAALFSPFCASPSAPAAKPASFLDRCARGELQLHDIDDFVAAWHESADGEDLQTLLGMTREEYLNWLLNPAALGSMVDSRKAAPSLSAA